MHEIIATVEKVTPEHVSSGHVEQMKNIEEEVQMEAEKVAKILEYFHSKVDTSEEMEEYLRVAQDKP